MPLVVPPGYANAAFTFTGAVGTQPYVTTLGLSYGLQDESVVDVANALFDYYVDNLLPVTTNQLTLDRVQLYVGDDGPSGSVDSSRAPVPGAISSSNFTPTAMSAIARKVTARLGRSGRGRMFLPGVLGEANVDQDGTIQAVHRTALNLALFGFREDMVAADGIAMLPYLLHTNATQEPDLITSFVVSDLVGWIRGRIR